MRGSIIRQSTAKERANKDTHRCSISKCSRFQVCKVWCIELSCKGLSHWREQGEVGAEVIGSINRGDQSPTYAAILSPKLLFSLRLFRWCVGCLIELLGVAPVSGSLKSDKPNFPKVLLQGVVGACSAGTSFPGASISLAPFCAAAYPCPATDWGPEKAVATHIAFAAVYRICERGCVGEFMCVLGACKTSSHSTQHQHHCINLLESYNNKSPSLFKYYLKFSKRTRGRRTKVVSQYPHLNWPGFVGPFSSSLPKWDSCSRFS